MGSSGIVCRLLDLENVFHIIWAQIIQGLINFHTEVQWIPTIKKLNFAV